MPNSVSETVSMFERAEYGEETLDESCRQKSMDDYINAYNALRETKKEQRKTRKRR